MSSYRRVNEWRAVVPVFLSHARFVELAQEDALAADHAAPDIRKKINAGEPWPPSDLVVEREATFGAYRAAFLVNFAKAAALTGGAVAGAVLVGFMLGRLSVSSPVAWGQVLAVLGAALMSWPTVMILGGSPDTMDGDSLVERVSPLVFKVLFVPGLLLASLAVIW